MVSPAKPTTLIIDGVFSAPHPEEIRIYPLLEAQYL